MWATLLLAAFELFIFLPGVIFYVLYLSSIVFNKKRPPFIPSHRRLRELIARELALAPGQHMVELGAGDMRVTLACWQSELVHEAQWRCAAGISIRWISQE